RNQRGYRGGHPPSALATAAINSLTVMVALPSASNAAQALSDRLPRAMLTPFSSSSTLTVPSSLQSPVQPLDALGAMAIAVGLLPTGIVATRARVRVSMTDTSPGARTLKRCRLATYAKRPSGVRATPSGPSPTVTVAIAIWAAVSITETLLALLLVTYAKR